MSMETWINWLHRARAERGQTLVEYALILVTIAVGVTAVMGLLRGQLVEVFSDIIDAF